MAKAELLLSKELREIRQTVVLLALVQVQPLAVELEDMEVAQLAAQVVRVAAAQWIQAQVDHQLQAREIMAVRELRVELVKLLPQAAAAAQEDRAVTHLEQVAQMPLAVTEVQALLHRFLGVQLNMLGVALARVSILMELIGFQVQINPV